MASSLLLRSSSRILASASRVASSAKTVSTTAVTRKDYMMNDPLEHATGVEKYELLAKQAGNDDPFFLKASKRGKGSKEEPNIVDAMDNYRMIGCVCNENDTHINWMWVFEGKPKRCECGYWFKLKQHPAPDKYHMPL